MPAVVAPFVVKILLTKIAFGITVGTLVNIATVYAVSQMLTKAARRKANGQGSGTGSDLVMSREPAPVRRIVYGETRVSGPMAFANVSGDKNSTLCVAVLLAAHECEAIGAYLVDDDQVVPDGAGNVMAGTYAAKLALSSHLGDQTTADAMLVSSTGGVWNSSHVLRGITYLAAKLTYDTDVYSGGLPNLSVILRGKKVYDPRSGLTAWSQNPALIVRDYLASSDYGLGCTADEIDDALIIAAANVCDEGVALKAGGTEARYRCNGTFTTDAEPAAIIETILSTMAGSITYSGGKFRVYAGAYSAPTVPLDEDDMSGAIEFQPATGIREACNIVKGSFTSPADLYQPRDFPRFADASHITADGEEIATDLDLAWVSSPSQAQRLAKIYERKARLGGTVSLKCNLSAFRCQTGETIAVSNTRLGWSEKVFQVQEWRFAIGNDGALGVDLTCRETDSSIYDWSASEEGILTTTSQFSNPPTTMQNVTGAVANSTPGTLMDLLGDTSGLRHGAGGLQWRYKQLVCSLGGFESFDGSAPSRRWLTRTGSGTYRVDGNSGANQYLACAWLYTLSGSQHYDVSTLVCTGQIVRTVTGEGAGLGVGGFCLQPPITPADWSCGCSTEYWCGTIGSTGSVTATQLVKVPSEADVNASGSHVVALSDEDNDWNARLRAEAGAAWTDWSNTAVAAAYEQRTTGITYNLVVEEYRGSWTGYQPGWFYGLEIETEIQPYGDPAAEWVAGDTISLTLVADSTGAFSVDETELYCPQGYRRRPKTISGPTALEDF